MPTDSSSKVVGVRRRACVNCTSVKSKCLPLSADECQRCNRLGKRCTYLNVVEKRKSPSSASRTRLLEQRLNRVLSMLSERAKGTPLSGFITQLSSADLDLDIDTLGVNRILGSSLPRSFAPRQSLDVIDHGFITLEEAQTLLDNYRTRAVPHFPFVPIAPDTTIQSLKTAKPFLFMCIMATMKVDNCTIQRQIGEEVRMQAHQRVLMQSESSLELLQGLLVYIAWYQYFFSYEKQQIVQLAQLCVSLVQNLGLDQNPNNTRRTVDLGPDETASGRKAARSTDQLRALLGTYCTTSWVSTKFRTRCAIPYTGYIKQSWEILSATKEYASDDLIAYLVRINELSRRICDTFGYDDLENTGVKGEFISAMALQTLSNESTLLKASIPLAFQENFSIKIELHLLDTLIGEVSLHDDFWDHSSIASSFATSNPSLSVSTRMSILFNLLRSCKSLNDTVMDYPDEELWYITFYTTAKICRTLSCLSNASKIWPEIFRDIRIALSNASFSYPGTSLYDVTTIERAADLEGEARRLQSKFKNLSPLVQNTGDEADIMFGFSDMIWAVFVAYDEVRGTNHGPLDFSIGCGDGPYASEMGSSGGYLSSTGSGNTRTDTVLDLEGIDDSTWEELLAGITATTDREPPLQL
ncbi:unnamed protein product [Fusarium venenatum]|uniref:Zn(2)-C6 fungal-type domain-containing protein n=1 Tax=Fusarium venenatum TaxID=56646 RepID=A0A2L2T3L7_9HYPO|nr:uncharacterized protein FVRRES_06659 [Fusarium venenatum]CEI62223.1 unnamed protein product [Fusarium venenatum]